MATIDTQTAFRWESLIYIPQFAFSALFLTGQGELNLNFDSRYLDRSIVAIHCSPRKAILLAVLNYATRCSILSCGNKPAKQVVSWKKRLIKKLTFDDLVGLPYPESNVSTIINRALSSSKVFEPERKWLYYEQIQLYYHNRFRPPCTDMHADIYYLNRYCAKIEKRSTKLQSSLREVLPAVRSTGPI